MLTKLTFYDILILIFKERGDSMNDRVSVIVDGEKKRKTIFVLKSKGKTLQDMVNEQLDKYAKEFDNLK